MGRLTKAMAPGGAVEPLLDAIRLHRKRSTNPI